MLGYLMFHNFRSLIQYQLIFYSKSHLLQITTRSTQAELTSLQTYIIQMFGSKKQEEQKSPGLVTNKLFTFMQKIEYHPEFKQAQNETINKQTKNALPIRDSLAFIDDHKENSNQSLPKQLEPTNKQKQSEANMHVFITDINYSKIKDVHHLFVFGILNNGERVTIKINNLKRSLYFILTSQSTQKQTQQEIREVLRRYNIFQFEGAFVDLKYIFEIKDIPRGDLKVFEVRYPFQSLVKTPQLELEGFSFKYIIGTTYTPLQIFIIRNRIKGPQWVSIPMQFLKAVQNNKEVRSSNKQEYILNNPQCIDSEVLRDKNIPPLKVMAISLKEGKLKDMKLTKKGISKKQQNNFCIYSLNYIFCKKYTIQSNMLLPSETQTVHYCLNYFQKPKIQQKKNTEVKFLPDENTLLTHFLNKINQLDPDIIVCHDSSRVLNTITNKLVFYKNQQMQRLGRLKLGQTISISSEPHTRLTALIRGRIVIDTMKQAQDAIKSNDHKLSTLSQLLHLKHVSDISYEQILKMIQCSEFTKVVLHTHCQAQATLELMSRLQILQSSIKLTNISGYLWQRVLDLNKAQRNQYLIMHECYKSGYLIPDKLFIKQDQDSSKYEGGKVLQPQKGLHCGFIVLLDFVSLYPSIIREYNICFSTVQRNLVSAKQYGQFLKKKEIVSYVDEQESIKIVPPSASDCERQNWGLLPKLIDILVSQRNKYKRLMGETKIQSQRSYYNTTQLAYKLVANSIYGCLGYPGSRFYAKDLAALITRLGRQTLTNAEDIVTNSRVNGQMCYDIIYGDTDSLMIKVIHIDEQESDTVQEKFRKTIRLIKGTLSQINSFYNIIKMQIDGAYNNVLLISKKKYGGNKLKNIHQIISAQQNSKVVPIFQEEYKGVQAIRNDSSGLLKQISIKLFKILFDDKQKSSLDKRVYEYITQLNDEISSHSFDDYHKYCIKTTLNKHPNLYKEDNGMPHVIVAKNLIQQGHRADSLINHMIQYVFIQGQKQAVPVDVNSFIRSKGKPNQFKIDKKYYKKKQIIGVLLRMFQEVKQIDVQVIKNIFLGQESKQNKQEPNKQGKYISLEIEIDKKTQALDNIFFEKFGLIKCLGCNRNYRIVRNGEFTLRCQEVGCVGDVNTLLPQIVNKFMLYLFEHVSNLYTTSKKCLNCFREWRIEVQKCQCCNQKFKSREIQSQFHDNLYLIRRVACRTIQKNKDSEQINCLIAKIDEFLQFSKFGSISGSLFAKLRRRC